MGIAVTRSCMPIILFGNSTFHATDPPSILYTTEYVVHRVSDFGSSGQLSCVVQTTPDTESQVTWWSNGEKLQEGDKYEMSLSEVVEGVKSFKLHIKGLKQSDIGSYLCQLSSEYNREESQEAWIQVDYRNGNKKSLTNNSRLFSRYTVYCFLTIEAATRIGGSLYTRSEDRLFSSSYKGK